MNAALSNSQKAAIAIGWFHQQMLSFPDAYPYRTADQLVAYIQSIQPSFMENYGKALTAATTPADLAISDATIKLGVTRIADQSGGRLPRTNADLMPLFFALSDEYGDWNLDNWIRVGSSAAVETAKDVAAVAAVGGTAFLIGAGIFFALSIRR